MNINELDSYNLGDAVKFNDKLNPRIWGADERMRPEVREQLLKVADDFREFLGIDVEVKDITVSGSNAAYTYTPHSDIDLHLVVDLPEADRNDVYRELFDAKKYAYNDMHDIRIGGYDVELYVQDANKKHHSQGIYSIVTDDWISVPKRRRPDIDDISVQSKFEDLGHRIESAIKSGSYEKMSELTEKLREYRQAGLDAHGEFGPENLAFKILRTQGLIKKLYDARNEAKDQLLSLDERKKKKKRVKYGYGGYWYPGTAYAGQDHPAGTEGGDGGGDGGGESIREDAGMTWDGVNPTTDMFTSEDATLSWDGVNPSTSMFTTETQDKTDEQILKDFVDFCVKELKLEQLPRIKLRRDPQWPAVHKTFGRYNDESKTLEVAWGQRHIMDVLRTVAHELTHKRQHEREDVPASAGETGSEYENEANARAGVLMRDYGRLHPEYFTVGQAHDLEEGWKQNVAAGVLGATMALGAVNPARADTGIQFSQAQVQQMQNRAELAKDIYAQMVKQRGQPMDAQQKRMWMTMAQEKAAAQIQQKQQSSSASSQSNLRQGSEVRRSSNFDKFEESASGYIPTKAQAKDPRYSMALTVDIKPGQVGKEANKLKLKTDKQGHPQIARANGLFENLYKEYKKFKADEDYSPDNPPGPEFKPTMPAGTLRVDVSDVYDWYKLGQHISRMKGLGRHDFGAGPPSSIISFGDEDTEHEFIDQIKATGLDVTDIDPKDPKKRLGRKIKTDPTYNVDEAIQAPVSKLSKADQDYLKFITAKLKRGKRGDQLTPREARFLQDLELKKKLAEFAPSPGYEPDPEDDVPRYLMQLANLWWNQADPAAQEEVARELAGGGWTIRQIDDDTVLLNHKEYGITYRISDDQFDPDLYESTDIDEVKMSPGALEKFATSDAAKGIRAGFEAELIFRDTQGESEELDPEPNYDADERCYSIQQVIDFFSNDEYGYGLSDRAQNRLMDDLDERYMEWRDEQIISDFRNDAEDLIRDILLEETPMDQRIHFYLTDSLQMSDEEADAVIKAGADAPKFTNSDAQKDYADENPEYKAYLEAADEAEQELEESVEFSVNRQDEYWDEALDKYRDDYSGDDDSFFSDVGLRWMSDVANEFNLDWPVWDGGEQQNYGSRGWEDIGNSLQDAVDMPVVVSSNYHSTRRRPGQWIIEPDGSLDPDDKGEEAGLEIVSPPMPLLTAIEKLRAVTDWANDPNGGNAYTNSSTGLHMGVSLPTMKSEAAGEDTGIDYVKLILFMGDKYVQQQFGREANTYCASALEKLRQNIKGKRSDPAGVVKLLQHGLTELAHRELQKGVGTSKYTSAHIQPGYIEFRSPGGDWLAKADEEIGVLENTMLRFARAMAIAGDPSAERQEYAKKLYKLVTADNPEYADQLKLFSEFSAGTINKEQLKKQWAETVLQKELPSAGKEEYEVYRMDNKNSPDATVGTLYARDYDDAYDQFLRQYGRDINNLDVRIKQPWFDVFDETGKVVATIRAKDIDTATDRAQYEFGQRWSDSWKIYRRPDDTPEPKASPRAQVAKRIAQPKPRAVGDDDASDWEAVYKPTGRVFDTLAHADTAQALAWRDIVMRSHGFDNVSDILVRRVGHQQAADARRDSADLQRNLGVRDVDIDVTQNFEPRRQNYELVSDEDPDRVIHRMPNATTDEVRAWIAQQEQGGMPAGFLRTRIVAEAVDPVSGAGTIPPKSIIKKTDTAKKVQPVEPVIKKQAYRSAIGQAISQQDLENMTRQIQVARRLGDDVNENFADGRVKGKSRPGRVKRAGASCKGSVTDLRARAKKYSGEKAKMYHWCANMKSGRNKK